MKNLTSSTVAAISKGGKVVVLLLRDDQLHRRSGSVGPVGVRLRQPKKSGVDDFMFVAALEVGRPFLFCRKRHLRVSVLASALPSGGNTPPEAFIGGGRALQGAPPLARCALALAWPSTCASSSAVTSSSSSPSSQSRRSARAPRGRPTRSAPTPARR